MNDKNLAAMSDATAQKVRREHMTLLKEIKKRQDKLWKTSVLSREFDIIQKKLNELKSELESRQTEFNVARMVLFSPAFNHRDVN